MVRLWPNPKSRIPNPVREGWQGWDEYAPFYDWENAQTLGRRDVPFWRRVASAAGGPVLELGCGTGRVSLPLARAGVELVGIDRSAPMLERAPSMPAARPPNPRNPQVPNPDAVSSAATSAPCLFRRARSRWCWRPMASCSR